MSLLVSLTGELLDNWNTWGWIDGWETKALLDKQLNGKRKEDDDILSIVSVDLKIDVVVRFSV